MTSLIQVKVDKELKEEAEKLFSDLGLDITTALRMFLKAAIREQRIPFELGRKNNIYSKENIAEIKKRAKELDNAEGISFSVDELMEFSNAFQNAKTQKEKETLTTRAKKGWNRA